MAQSRSFDAPDEQRTPDKTQVDILRLGDAQVARFTMQPGWRWSECVKPIAGTESCRARHLGIVVSGRMHVRQDDGTEADLEAGQAYVIEPGHDAWIDGDEVFVGYEFEAKTVESYAKPDA